MMSWACGRRSIGNVRANRSGLSGQPQTICGRQRRGGPGVHDVGITDEAAGHAALLGTIPVGHVGRRIDRQPVGRGLQHLVVLNRAVVRDRIPQRKRHAEKSLPADAPVAVQTIGPVFEARLHVGRMPLQLARPRQQRLTLIHGLDEPLAAGDDLERPVALLEELHRMRDRPRLADQLSRGAQLLDDPGARFRDGQTDELGVRGMRRARHRSTPTRAFPTAARAACRRAG